MAISHLFQLPHYLFAVVLQTSHQIQQYSYTGEYEIKTLRNFDRLTVIFPHYSDYLNFKITPGCIHDPAKTKSTNLGVWGKLVGTQPVSKAASSISNISRSTSSSKLKSSVSTSPCEY
jgi:hypothetical protein